VEKRVTAEASEVKSPSCIMLQLKYRKPRRATMITQPTASGIRDAIAAANEEFVTAVKRGDAASLAALYTENGQVLPPNGDFVTGKGAIQMFWQAVMDMGIKEAKLEIVEVEGHGDTATEISTFTLYGAGGEVLDKGKYIVIWKRESGQWKLHRDIFNSSMPAPG
jgi:uncharacterized protein (TIGR02246 family)